MPHRTRPMAALLLFTGVNAVLVSTIGPVYDFVCFLPYWERRKILRFGNLVAMLPYLFFANRGALLPCLNLDESYYILMKSRRPASNHLDTLALEDIAKYFDIPIIQASRKLRVGLTLLKKKCREFGIPRWPHRKIKSLDLLIRSLQIQRKEMENKDEAMAMAERRKMIESERQNIERKPFVDINMETKKVRQIIFKRRLAWSVFPFRFSTAIDLYHVCYLFCPVLMIILMAERKC
ncbi:hypothetical protein LIER_39032 [Lithospermum erythrorhizon]|uniref:RWP-RK domain-containing protein n=1 Tax=Lithospermum erythrorhizon TaxID=34254 RepID=A0AAV3Q9B1_LITER